MRALLGRWSLTLSEEDRRLLVDARSRPLTLSEDDWDRLRGLVGRAQDQRRGWRGRLELVSHLATALAAVVAVVALALVARQTDISATASKEVARQTQIGASASKATQKAVEATVWAAATAATMDFDKALLEHDQNGRLSPYLYESASFDADRAGTPRAPESTQRRFDYLALMQIDLLDGYWGLADFLPETFIDKDSVGRWMRSTFANSPELCRTLARFQDSFADGLVNRAAEACGRAGVPLPFTPHRFAPTGAAWASCNDKDPRTKLNCVWRR